MQSKHILGLALLLFAISTLAANQLQQPEVRLIPRMLNYQGYLTDTLGVPITDNLDMTFRIFDAVSSGNELWSETQLNVPVERSVFSVLLGETTPIPDSVFSDFTSTWLELTLNGTQTLSPRTRITAVGYAYTSTYSDTAEYAVISAADSDWTLNDDVLYPSGEYGLSMRSGNMLYGAHDSTHVNLGVACTTGTSGQNHKYCTVAGGICNAATYWGATVSGGERNIALSDYTCVGGGSENLAGAAHATVGGGYQNAVSEEYGTIGGGEGNTVSDHYATVAGGEYNTASGGDAFVGGGATNTASGSSATIAGGYYNAASGSYSTLGGGYVDTVRSHFGGVFSGRHNRAGDAPEDTAAVVAGGRENAATGKFSTVGGGALNLVASNYSTIPGGFGNTIAAGADYCFVLGIGSTLTQDSTVMVDMPHIWFGDEATGYEFPGQRGTSGQVMVTDGSGQMSWSDSPSGGNWSVMDSVLYTNNYWGIARGNAGNIIYGDSALTHINLGIVCTTGVTGINIYYCTVGGGYGNKASNIYTTVGGGRNNMAADQYATVAGGNGNVAYHGYATVGGGGFNRADSNQTTISGGYSNTARHTYAAIGGGYSNDASAVAATIGGGHDNTASDNYATVAGGRSNIASEDGATVAGGCLNSAINGYSFVGGGYGNDANGYGTTIAGGYYNIADSIYATIGGGYTNTSRGRYAVLVGGFGNTTGDTAATVGGGYGNDADSSYTTIAGGRINTARGTYSIVGGGYSNVTNDYAATIGGGYDNTASGAYAFVGGGYSHTASGKYATIPGGYDNTASGTMSFAAGYRAIAQHRGCFVWADSTGTTSFSSTAVNQFRVRATGGIDLTGNVAIRSITSGNVVVELGEGLDYAEGFDISNREKISPGTVLCIDPAQAGRLRMSDTPYDTKVAGIAAGAKGLSSGVQLGSGQFDCNVALAGRVYCNVDATESSVEPGDLLTTSAIPGYAMKVIHHERAQGAIIGKAMERLEKGNKGQILVLVALQ